MQILLLFSHTYWANSKVNKALLESAKTLENVTIHNLNTAYPDGKINTEAEIALLQKADKIIAQFPLFWFKILTHIHHSANPKLLSHKKFSIITTAGGDETSYDGHHGYTLDTLLSSINYAFSYNGCEVQEIYCIYKANVDNLPIREYLLKLQG